MPKCKNDPYRSYKGTEPSPKGLGYCAHGMKVGDKKKGKDGNMWIIKKIKNGSLRWIKYKERKNIKLYLEPIITIFNTENDDEIYRGLLNNTPKKYKSIIINYLNKVNKKFFNEMFFSIWFQTWDSYIQNKFNIPEIKNPSKKYILKSDKFMIKKNLMIYDITFNSTQLKFFNYLIYSIKSEINNGADGWAEGNIVFLDTKKVNKLKLGKLDKNIAIDIFPIFKKIKK